MSRSISHPMGVDELLHRAEEYATALLRTSVMLREAELINQKRNEKYKGSKRRQRAGDSDEAFDSPASP